MNLNRLGLFLVFFKLAPDSVRNCLALKITLLVLLIFGASSSALTADRQTPARILQPDQVHRGDQITVYDKSGRVFELIVEAVTTPAQLEPDTDLTGTYISEITDNENRYFRKANHKKLVVRLIQDDKKITGIIDSLAGGHIEGTREGDTVKFSFYGVPAISNYVISGEWKVSASGDLLDGSWKHPVDFDSGKWNLTRRDSAVATRDAGPPMIKGWLVADESRVEIRLADVAKIESKKSDLAPESILETPSISNSVGAPEPECSASEEAVQAIENARSAWNQAEYTPGMYDLIIKAEATAKPPNCDSDEAIELAGQAVRLAAEYGKFPSSPEPATPTYEPEQVKAKTLPSRPDGSGIFEIGLSRLAFDDGNLSGRTFLWGLAVGVTVYSHYEIAYSYHDVLPLVSPDLDEPAELGEFEYLHIGIQMLSLRRNWRVTDTTTAFALVGYSKIKVEIDQLSLCTYCGFTINSEGNYRSKLSGPAWGVGLQWKTSSNGYRSLKYMDYSERGFEFRGVHLNFGTYFY